MAKLGMPEIAKLAHNAGIKKFEALRDAIAIAMAESSGRTDARNTNPTIINAEWGPAIGLWQIHSRKPEEGKGTSRDASRLTDPAFNAASMFQISNGGTNWGPWQGYRSAQYFLALPQAASAARAELGTGDVVDDALNGAPGAIQGAVDATQGVATGIADIAAGVKGVTAWIGDRNNIMRVAKVAAGVALLVGGLFIFARPVAEKIPGASTAIKAVRGK